MIGMVVRGNDQGELATCFLNQVLHAGLHALNVTCMNAAIDQNVFRTSFRRHCDEEEISKADSVHPHTEVALCFRSAACCSSLRSLRGALF